MNDLLAVRQRTLLYEVALAVSVLHLVVFVLVLLMRRFMPMRRMVVPWQPRTGPITGPRIYTFHITCWWAVAIIAREQWRDENNITRDRCRGRLRPALDAGVSRPPRHQRQSGQP